MKKIKIDESELELNEKRFISCNILKVSVGTTGLMGGDGGHGGRTILTIFDEASTSLRYSVLRHKEINGKCSPVRTKIQDVDGISIILSGDTELETFYTGLKFAVEELGKYVNDKYVLVENVDDK